VKFGEIGGEIGKALSDFGPQWTWS